MTVHFIHVGKTGGTALKRALVNAGVAYRTNWEPERARETPLGRVALHQHGFKLRHVPAGDVAFFCVRDPIARFLSGFYSRLNKGQPRYYYEWSEAESRAFEQFPTPQRLAAALASDDPWVRDRAAEAMRSIVHLGGMRRQLGRPRSLRARRGQIVYIARQETLDRDWEQIKALLHLPSDLPLPGGVQAHRQSEAADLQLDDTAIRALRTWYRVDYELLRYCDRLRAWHGWGTGTSPRGAAYLRRHLARARALPAIFPPPPPLRREPAPRTTVAQVAAERVRR